ncbi:MAG: hypothetical protein NTZ17_15380 [Phycisphaerae bacterium]|nr:hypothetical protein [Phycisphaerae bacterium]
MTKRTPIPGAFEQTVYQQAELDALRRMLMISEGTFSLNVATCNSPALRDHLIAQIKREMDGVEVVRVPEKAHDIFDLAHGQILDTRPRAVFIIDMEKAITEGNTNRVVQGLNVSREHWYTAYRCPIVFWLPDRVTSLLMTQARDLWSWVSPRFEFVSEQPTLAARQHHRQNSSYSPDGSPESDRSHRS